MPARIAGSGTPRYPPRDYPDHPDPHVRFAHIPSASAREAMANFIPYTPTDDNDQEAIVAEFPASTVIKDAELGRREPIWAHYLPDQLRFEDDHDDTPKDREYIRPSDAGKCARQLGYIASGTEVTDPPDDASILAFAIGGFLHRTWQAGVARLFEEMRADYEAEHGDGAVPGPGIPWTVVIEEHFDRFDTTLTLPPRKATRARGADRRLRRPRRLRLRGHCSRSTTPSRRAARLRSRSRRVSTWPVDAVVDLRVLKGAERIAVLNLAKENISANAASRCETCPRRSATPTSSPSSPGIRPRRLQGSRPNGASIASPTRRACSEACHPRVWLGTEVIAPANTFEDGTTGWSCDYCSFASSASPTAPAGFRSPRPACSPSA